MFFHGRRGSLTRGPARLLHGIHARTHALARTYAHTIHFLHYTHTYTLYTQAYLYKYTLYHNRSARDGDYYLLCIFASKHDRRVARPPGRKIITTRRFTDKEGPLEAPPREYFTPTFFFFLKYTENRFFVQLSGRFGYYQYNCARLICTCISGGLGNIFNRMVFFFFSNPISIYRLKPSVRPGCLSHPKS